MEKTDLKSFLKASLILFMFFIPVQVFFAETDEAIIFSQTEWNAGSIEYGLTVEQEVSVTNKSSETVTIDLISTCSCMSTEPEQLEINSGNEASFKVIFDSHDDKGEFEKILIIQTDSELMPKGFFIVYGTVIVPEGSVSEDDRGSAEGGQADSEQEEAAGGTSAELIYYYTPGCKSCNKFLKDAELPIIRKDITDAGLYEELQDLLESRGLEMEEIPVLVTDSNIYQGEEEVISGYKAVLSGDEKAAAYEDVSSEPQKGRINLTLPAVIAAGLLDGVNPCAFTTLIFLLSALSVAGRSRRETLVIGLFFTSAVFVTYFLIGLGFFKIIRIADSFHIVSEIIRWVLFGVLLIFAGLSLFDYTRIRAGKAGDIVLQLPDSVKRRMHSSIRTYSKSAALAGSSIIMGFLISIFELGCTGQIYFPTITYIIQTDRAASGYLFLLFYNLAFILPLAGVFVVVYFGITSKKITKTFQNNLGIVKILTAVLFLTFAALMILI